jgi:PKD repeat protein
VEHSYAEDGNYTVTLTVTDDDGASSSTSATKTILNSPPVAVFTESAETVYNGETIFFNASDSYDPDGVIVSYYWDFGDGSNATGVTVEHAYADDGNYTVTLTVTDDDGATTSTSTTKTVLNYPPTAIFTESAQTVLTGELIDFDASDSYDSDGNITSYFWDFGDGTNATGMIISHAYADDGNYTVTLTVTDNDGATSTTNATKTILNRPPVIELTVSSTVVLTDEVITFNASDSYDPDGFIVSYYWDFDDGTNATGAVVEHAYADNGTYLVTLILTDDDGASSTATVTIEVHNRSPVAVFTESAETVYTGETIFFNASDSYDPDGSIVSYFWDFGDGTNATGITVEHAYADNGTYTVTLNVTDDDGATCTTNATKTILNSSPVAVFTESAETVYTGETIFFNASDSYDPDGSIVSYFWDFGDGTNATGVTVEHAYMEDGNYTVILMVIDDDGANASTSTIKTILNRSPIPLFTESAETVYTGETIFFNASDSYDPDGSIVSYFWDFGDGSNATGVTVEHAYADDGNYTVTLTVTDDDGATASTTATKTILNRPPTAVFTESAETVYMGQVIYFNASDTYDVDGYIVSYYWDFGDGSNATGVTVEHTYEINGTYTVTLTVTDDDGATNSTSSTKTILWNDSPVAVFTESAETVYTGETITFNATDSYDPDGNITSYFWDFGDGTNATGVIVEHSYADDGNYTVTLTVTDNIGATGTATATKTVLNRSPVAVFTESAETVYTGETIFFNASDSYDPDGSIVSYFWDFGDGTNATGITAEHTYADDGNYTVTLTVTDDDGASASVSSTKTILNRSPVASFVYSPSFPIAGEIVVFNASDSYDPDGVIVSYYWDFGDGTNATGVTVEHIFTNYGEYTVTLHVTDDNNATGTTARIINIRDYPTAAFTYSPIHPGKGQSITFNASSSSPNGGFIVNYTWDFGDGNITTISDPIITHVYEITGNYTVLLTVTDSEDLNGSQSQTLEVGISPVVYFTYSPDLPFAGDLVTFNASASYDPDGYIVNYTWDFGDGNITTISDPIITHVYTKGDNYMVRLVAIDNKGCSNSTSQIVTIEDYPTADFVYSPSFPIAGETVTFNASSSSPNGGFIVNYTWDFGDGTQLNTSDPIATHTYAAHGDFMVTLTVIDNYGLSGSVSKTIRIRDYPIASFDFSPNPAQRNVTTTFNATTSDPVGGTIISYIWDFGDGNVTTTTNPIVTHIYTETGTYDATLTVIDDEDLNSSISKSVWVINADPVAIFTCTPEKPIVGETATFNASDSYDPDGLIVSYTWDFGDGTTGSNIVAYHTFNEIGTYEVTLTVEDDYGNTGSTSHIIEVIAYPTANFTWSPEEYPKVLEPVIFNASSSLPGSGTILNYTWDFNDGNITTTTDPVITHIYNESGQYAVTLTVINSDGLSDSITKRVDLYGTPEANFTWTPASPLTGETITFNASTSKLNGGFVGTYTWDFGDGTYDKGVIVYHTYTEAGTYNVTLKVENSAGLSDTVSAEITVLSAPQVIFTWSPEYPYEYDKIVFNASSSLPGSGTILNYTWDFNDGNITTTTDPVITHIYNESGQYAVALTIINSEGLSNTTSKTVNIAPAESPIADFTYSPPSPGVYGEVTFNASNCIARGGVIVSYTWDFGDGNITTVTTPIISHTYQTEGNYTVALNVTNTAGYWGVVTKQIEVVPISDPTANFTWSPLQPTFNQTITFNASDSMPGWNGSAYPPIVSYTWDFGDGNITTTTDPIIYHAYAQDGNYTVTLTVVDSDGRSGNLTRIVTVTALLGDINGDGKVDIYDVAYVAKRFGSSEGDPEYDPKADFNGDGKIDIYDVATVAKQFGKTL